MEQLRCAGATVGEYVGNGQGERERTDIEDKCDEEAEPVVDDDHECEEASGDIDDNAPPLLFFYDCETTGFSIYTEHITEIAAKVVGVPLSSFSQPTFSSLVKTSRNISKKGITIKVVLKNIIILIHVHYIASDKTGITTALLRPEKPLSKVLPEFLKWIYITTQEYNEASGCDHYPGLSETLMHTWSICEVIACVHAVLVAHNGYRFDFPMLLAEIERRPEKLALSQLSSHRIHFSDTLGHLKQVRFTLSITIHEHVLLHFFQAKKDGHSTLKLVTKFGLEDLYHHFFTNDKFPGIHTAQAKMY